MPQSADLAVIRRILQKDRTWALYALADLAPQYSGSAEWHVAPDERPAVLLLYRGFDPPVLFAFGNAPDVALLLPEIANEPAFYVSMRPEAAALLPSAGYQIPHAINMWRMLLDPARFAPRAHTAMRLGSADFDALKALYHDGDASGEAPPFFDAAMLQHGVYYGIREGGEIIAAAGTHVLAAQEGVAGIGNVYTRRDRRGRGLGTQVTSAVAAELLRLEVPIVALNVAHTNAAARHVYERLGFRPYCEYREGRAISVPFPPGP